MKKFGIVNISPNSFSKDCVENFDEICKKILNFKNNGFYGIDIGAQATNPNVEIITESEEFARLEGVLPKIAAFAKKLNLALSIDTFYPKITEFAVSCGFDYINDVSGLQNDEMLSILQKYDNTIYILMHSLSVPAKRDIILPENSDVIDVLVNFAMEKIEKLMAFGTTKERIIFDPGIGFGKNLEQNWEILRNIKQIKAKLNVPIYLGFSRKSFLSCITDDIPMRDIASQTLAKFLENDIDFVRLH